MLRFRFLGFCLALVVPSAAVAEPVLLLPPKIEPGVDIVHGQEVLGRVREWLVERGDRPTLITGPQAERAGLENPCSSLTCAQEYLKYYGVPFAMQTIVWAPRRDAGGRHGTVTLALIQAPDIRYMAAADVNEGAGSAAQQALAAIQKHLARGEGPWLEVTGKPEGATVTVNGRKVGALPYLGKAEPGEQVVEVFAEGHESYGTTIFLGKAADEYRELKVDLQKTGRRSEVVTVATDHSEVKGARKRRGPLLGLLAGSALVLASAPLLYRGALDRKSWSDWGGRVQRSRLFLAMGSVFALSGGTAILWSSIRFSPAVDTRSAGLVIAGAF